MAITGLVVFVALYFVEAGYGKMISDKWGPAINNKVAWVIMECPVFFVMLYLWGMSDRRFEIAPLAMFLIFQSHYFQRSFIFPCLLKGKSKMPIVIMMMGFIFNMINGSIQGYWIFYLSPADMYTADWFLFYERKKCKWYYPIASAGFPLAYMAFIFIQAAILKFDTSILIPGTKTPLIYPYFFVNLETQGVGGVAKWAVLMFIAFMAVGFLFYGIDRLLKRRGSR